MTLNLLPTPLDVALHVFVGLCVTCAVCTAGVTLLLSRTAPKDADCADGVTLLLLRIPPPVRTAGATLLAPHLKGKFLFRAFLNLPFRKACTRGFKQELMLKQYCGIQTYIALLEFMVAFLQRLTV